MLDGASYVIVGLLGRDGQGEVYLAQHGFTLMLAVVNLLHRTLHGDRAQMDRTTPGSLAGSGRQGTRRYTGSHRPHRRDERVEEGSG